MKSIVIGKFILMIIGIFVVVDLGATQSNTFPGSGNVGIGTTSPQVMLQVQNEVWAGGKHVNMGVDYGVGKVTLGEDYWGGGYIQLAGDNNADDGPSSPQMQTMWIHVRGNGNYMGISSPEVSDILVVHKSGNTGIGTTDPEKKLTVNGDIKTNHILFTDHDNTIYKQGFGFGINSDRGYLFRQNWTSELGDYIEINNQDATGGGSRIDYIFRISGSKGFQFIPREAEAMRITPSGNVGIGTTNPTTRLAVNGITKTKEILVTEQANDWPDHVFSDAGYRLPDLRDLEAFIKKHKHLPGIPTKEEVEQNGQNLGVIQARLLEKIEELTLHTIKQQKFMLKQRERIKTLEEEVRKLKSNN